MNSETFAALALVMILYGVPALRYGLRRAWPEHIGVALTGFIFLLIGSACLVVWAIICVCDV